jgi:hypothetical protein
MLSKCANPACSASFRYLRQGKVFVADWVGGADAPEGNTCWRKTEMFWLCDTCSKQMTLTKQGNRVLPVARGKAPEPDPTLRELRIYG